MGASIGNALGMKRAQPEDDKRPVVAVIGDSTFVHSGITGLLDAVYNGTAATICILDNSTTAMTGGQDHPASGKTLAGNDAPKLDLAALARVIGVEDVLVVDPYDQTAVEMALKYAIQTEKPSVVIAQGPCVLIDRKARKTASVVDVDKCNGCTLCLRTGCPALESIQVDGKLRVVVNTEMCAGCGVCIQVCRQDAIGPRRSEGGPRRSEGRPRRSEGGQE